MADNEAIKYLKSIDATLKALLSAHGANRPSHSAAAEIADNRDLDSKYGDPLVKFSPRDWTGENYKGCRFSQCPPALLDMLARAYDYFARKAEESGETLSNGKPAAPYKRKDAARARGWAARLRSGWKPEDSPIVDSGMLGGSELDGDDISF